MTNEQNSEPEQRQTVDFTDPEQVEKVVVAMAQTMDSVVSSHNQLTSQVSLSINKILASLAAQAEALKAVANHVGLSIEMRTGEEE